MKKKIVFMLQNGIGFGHFKLALNISKYLKEEYIKASPTSKSLASFRLPS